MFNKSTVLSFFALATMIITGFTACKKQSVTPVAEEQVTVTARMTNPGQEARVALSSAQFDKLQKGEYLRLQSVSANEFTAAPENTDGTGLGASAVIGGVTPGGCPPISNATLQFYANQANACCCTVIVCLQGADCAYYIFAFVPSNGCSGGNES
jgi:hypothetical protein